MTNLPDDIRDCLQGELERHDRPHCLVLAPRELLANRNDLGVTPIVLDEQFDPAHAFSTLADQAQLAIVINAPSVLSRAQTRQLLGQLRNYAAGAVIAAFSTTDARRKDSWSIADFLGLGFRRLRPPRRIESPYWLYRYDIYDYKITPDWLNSRHWANPEQWGKSRW